MPDANALDVRDALVAKMDELKKGFPKGVEYTVAFDTTPYTRESIREVFHTLRDSLILVAAVVLLFLQNWRSAIIPLAAVFRPSSAPRGDGGLRLLAQQSNAVRTGAVDRHRGRMTPLSSSRRRTSHRARHEAARRHHQGDGAGIRPGRRRGVVLSAVFIPCAFITGITGQFFRQFALTIAVSTIISAFKLADAQSRSLCPAAQAASEGDVCGDAAAGVPGRRGGGRLVLPRPAG